MDNQLVRVISELPTDNKFTDGRKNKIQRLFPVPSDYTILWAVAESLGHHPSGLVIADKGIIIKANEKSVEAANASIGKKWSKSNKTSKTKFIYQIIPWDLFDPDDYVITGTEKTVTIAVGDIEIPINS